MPAGFHVLMGAQFACALADNALLIVAIALLGEWKLAGWWAPLLKFGFTVSYVVFAPFVGALADAVAKASLMAWMNGVKIAGVLGLLAGVHPMLAFTVIGFGAAAHAPAKYGLVTELVGPGQLVRANGWLEVSVVCAALLGAVVGGSLVSPAFLACARRWTHAAGPVGELSQANGLTVSLAIVLALYLLAAGLSTAVPDSGVRYAPGHRRLVPLAREFWHANLTLWRDRDGGLSLAVTTLFWGVGATLQFAVLRWAADVQHLPLNQSAYLQAAVAIGVVAGASVAARWVPLARAKSVLVAGVMLGLMLPLIASTSTLSWAIAGLTAVGVVGGVLVVPLNALLQHRGYVLFSAGRSVAVQGFNENACVLAMLGTYAALIAADASIVALMWGLGLGIAAAIGALIWREARLRRRSARAPRAEPAVGH